MTCAGTRTAATHGRRLRQAICPERCWQSLEQVCSAAASDDRGRHPLPTPAAFAHALAELGIGDGDVVLAYDDAGGVLAARLVWMLRTLGHEAALLDVGLGPFPETGPGPPLPRLRPPLTVPDRWPARLLAVIDEVAARGDDTVLIDARPADRFAGAPDPLDPRPGHIPGARSLPCREHLGPDGRLLDGDRLRARLAAVGIDVPTIRTVHLLVRLGCDRLP